MAVVPMRKIGLVAHRNDFDDITSQLAEMGIVQISAPDNPSHETGQILENLHARIDKSIAFLQGFVEKEPEPLKLSYSELVDLADYSQIQKTLDKIEEDQKRIARMETEKTTLLQQIQNIEPYKNLPYRLEQIHDSDHICTRVGFVPQTYADHIDSCSRKFGELCWVERINSDPNGDFLLIVFHRSIEDDIEQALSDCEFARFHFGEFSDKPSIELAQLKDRLGNIEENLIEYHQSLHLLSKVILPKLKGLRGFYRMKISEIRLKDTAEKTEQTLYLTGWVKTPDLSELLDSPPGKLSEAIIEPVPPDENETPPVALQNPPVVEAFEVITDLYGRPRSGMVDPTPFIAPFFPLFFGLCLTDAGYGLLLVLLSGGMLAFGKLNRSTRKFMRFILYSGIATVILGALAGGWFGMDLSSSSSPIARALLSIKVMDPLENAIQFFALSVFLGTIQVSVGFAVGGYVGFKESRNFPLKIRAVLLALSWISVSVGAGVFIASYLMPETMDPYIAAGTNLLKFGALGIVLFSIVLGIAGKRGVGGSISDGLAFDGLYGIINLFGDLLSYARLLALGLSTGVIAGVINIIAKQLSQMIPGVGIVFAALLVIVGHAGYTALSALGAFVHPARLHYVEYFGKFYEGGGEPFEPFSRKIDGVKLIK